GGLVALDASPNIENVPPDTLREALAVTDILLPNRREMQAITGVWETGAGLDALLCRVPIAALKLGAEGSALGIRGGYSETGRWHVPAVEVTPLDTTGAGDAFNAGFLASYLRGEKPEDWLRAGNALAARAISQKGAVPFDGMEEKVCAGVG
ncbi:carbohydrate kinase family protein, partial [Anaerotruncus massiliensis (ex Liu et al. 2021)]|uniref:carbohydrate kinase family protein n=3 Tax=Oscillospiraceae TaxID=216572 RepID=UPI003AF04238